MIIAVNQQTLYICDPKLMVSSTRHVYTAQYVLSSEWSDLPMVTAVFLRPDGRVYETLIEDPNEVPIPWEVFELPGKIRFGVFGVDASNDVNYPTVWSEYYRIPEGCQLGEQTDPSPSLITRLIEIAESAEAAADGAVETADEAMEVANSVREDADAGEFDGAGITSITKVQTEGLVDTYEITYSDGRTSRYTITNGAPGSQGPAGPQGEAGVGIASIDVSYDGLVHHYTITLTNGDTITDDISDGVGISNINKTASAGTADTYTITYTDGSTSQFVVYNGEQGPAGPQGPQGPAGQSYVLTNSDKVEIANMVIAILPTWTGGNY